jgi:phosphohistidine phosphatase
MRELLLLRHGKSSWADGSLEDHDRELAPRGERAAKAIGRLIRKEVLIPDLILSSTARRAEATTRIVVKAVGSAIPVTLLKSLYLASPSELLRVVRRQPAEITRLMVVGHNPGLHRFALRLCQGREGKAAERLAEKFPTCGMARIAIDGETWGACSFDRNRLLDFIRPRELEESSPFGAREP